MMAKQLTLDEVIKIAEMDKGKEIFGLDKLTDELLVRALNVELGKAKSYIDELESRIIKLEKIINSQKKNIENLKKKKQDEVVNKKDSAAYKRLAKHCTELESMLARRRDELNEINHELHELRFLTSHIE